MDTAKEPADQAGGAGEPPRRGEAQGGGLDELEELKEEVAAAWEEVRPDATQLAIAAGGALLVGLLYLILPESVTYGPKWLPLAVELLLVTPSLVAAVFLGR